MLLRMRRSELLARRAIASFRNEMRRLLSLSSPTTIEIQREGEGEENLVVLPRVRACLARYDAASVAGDMCGAENVRIESLRAAERCAEVAARLAVLGSIFTLVS